MRKENALRKTDRKTKRIRRRCISFWSLTFLLMALLLFFTTATAAGQSKHQIKIEKKYYAQLEQAYLEEIRGRLKAHGISDSGINMTHVSYEDDSRIYKVVIHNRQLGWLSCAEREALCRSIEKIPFPAEDCRFFHEFNTDKWTENGL